MLGLSVRENIFCKQMAGQVETEVGNGVPIVAVEVLQVLQEPTGKSFAAFLH